jgi:hypothetical protein
MLNLSSILTALSGARSYANPPALRSPTNAAPAGITPTQNPWTAGNYDSGFDPSRLAGLSNLLQGLGGAGNTPSAQLPDDFDRFGGAGVVATQGRETINRQRAAARNVQRVQNLLQLLSRNTARLPAGTDMAQYLFGAR